MFGFSGYGLASVNYLDPHNNRIYIAGLFPMTSRAGHGDDDEVSTAGAGVLPSVRLALKHVNENRKILPDHELYLQWNDTEVIKI